ncbi:MAG TPA: hypothetical protein VGF24_14630 [Vicinamibacterales bacterium]|jgi:hypothetical protein
MKRAPWHLIVVVLIVVSSTVALRAQRGSTSNQQVPTASQQPPAAGDGSLQFAPEAIWENLRAGLGEVAIRLPWAALLGTALALRPRRAGSPPRDPAVIETQIVLAIVGALIMLIVGASLARAFGIAGAANLIRYRAKIEDPKDAVVMLAALSVGLASGVGLFGIATAATFFLCVTLWIIEGFENRVRTFLLTIKLGEHTPEHRRNIERILRRGHTMYELRTTADEELSYLISANNSLNTEKMTAALSKLAPQGKASVEWKEETKARPLPEKDAA